MPNRDYAARSNKSSGKSGVNKLLILVIILLLLGMSVLALMLLKSKEPVAVQHTQPTAVQAHQKSELPTPPTVVYSYIRDLETREVPVDKNAKIARLTREQEQRLQQQKEENEKKLAQKVAAQNATPTSAEDEVEKAEEAKPKVKALTPDEFAKKKAAEQKAVAETAESKWVETQNATQKTTEEKRKVEELNAQTAKSTTSANSQAEKVSPKIVAKAATEAPKSEGRFGLQCGAFKNKVQAENTQARLIMAGFNARIVSNSGWNRVAIGPVGDRAAASRAQMNARVVAECIIVAM